MPSRASAPDAVAGDDEGLYVARGREARAELQVAASSTSRGRGTSDGEAGPQRKRMPRERQSITHKFSIGGHEGYITAGMYEDGTVGEIFLTDVGKEGSTLRGMMNSFATAISISLQYGVPLETLVRSSPTCASTRKGSPQPGDPVRQVDARLHHALARVALPRRRRAGGPRHPHQEVRARRTAEDIATGAAAATPPAPATAATAARTTPDGRPPPAPRRAAASAMTDSPPVLPARMIGLDLGPACSQCGGMMQRTGSCYTCSSCGNNTGCG